MPSLQVGTAVIFEYTEHRRRRAAEGGDDSLETSPQRSSSASAAVDVESATQWRWAVGTVARIHPHDRLVTLGLWDAPRRDGFTPQDERTAFELERAIESEEDALRRQQEELAAFVKQTAEIAKGVQQRRDETSKELDEVRPALAEARAALAQISEAHLRELRSYTTPPDMVRKVLEAVMQLIGQPCDTWAMMRAFVRSDDLIPTIRDFNPEKIAPAARQRVETMIEKDKTFTLERCSRASKAAGPMYQWVLAQIRFSVVWHRMAPLLEELELQRSRLQDLEDRKAQAIVDTDSVEERLRGLRARHQEVLYGVDGESSDAGQQGFEPNRSRPGLWRQRVDGREKLTVILHSSILRVLAKGVPQSGTYDLTAEEAPKPGETRDSAEAALQQRAAELEQARADIERRAQRAETSLAALTEQSEGSSRDAATKLASLQGDLEDTHARLETVTADLEKALGAAEERAGHDAMRVEVLEEELQDAKKRDADNAAEASRQAAESADAIDALRRELAEERRRYEDVVHERDAAADNHASAGSEVEELREQLAEARQRATAAERSSQEATVALADAKAAAQDAERRANEATAAAASSTAITAPQQPQHVDPEPSPSLVRTSHAIETAHVATQTDAPGADESFNPDELEYTDDSGDEGDAAASPDAPPVHDEEASGPRYNEELVPLEDSDDEGVGHPFQIAYPDIERGPYLLCSFPVEKVVQSAFGARKLRRTWVVDCLQLKVHNCGNKGAISKTFELAQLAMVERAEAEPRRLRLVFNGVGHDHSLVFDSGHARERFVELVQLLRPGIVSCCPSLMPTGHEGLCKTAVDTSMAAELEVDVVGGKISGGGSGAELVVDVSTRLFETLTFWVGTHNLDMNPPSTDSGELDTWLPRGAADIYAVAVQHAGEGTEAAYETFEAHLGGAVLRVASIELEEHGVGLVLFARRSVLAKISNCEGSKTQMDDEGHGAVALGFHVLDTKVNVLSFFLPSNSSAGERGEMLRESMNRLQVGLPTSDVTANAHHVFVTGELGYGLMCDQAELSRAVGAQDYQRLLRSDSLNLMRRASSARPLAGFYEATIHFPPTAFTEKGAGYLSRVLHYSSGEPPLPMRPHERDEREEDDYEAHMWLDKSTPKLRSVAYGPSEEMVVSPFLAVAAMYKLRARRPVTAVLSPEHEPTYRIVVTQVMICLDMTDKLIKSTFDGVLKSPSVRVSCPLGSALPTFQKTLDVADGAWRFAAPDTSKSVMDITTNSLEVINSELLSFTLFDAPAAAGKDVGCVGMAAVPLNGRIGHAAIAPNKPCSFNVPVMRHGGVIGTCSGQMYWEVSPTPLMDSVL